ncbi:MAG: hypothetical protein ACD_9C00015G0002 [uncultured bacterium]|nr:MAG: hypothetical protein ACD_9C00015G0002 [uncultured bacterium]KKT01471.1 MAG: hypothetical protein UV80_C0014G0003 [Candidatus Peregrinibacteria bacterium GW2011_GWF2_43_17]KKT18596.1 MAG: hypothetical protein UW03_C0037G0017 [Candidatus Peregrinibacteria bacterium GW2011_GWA2_43_8]HAU39372.1 hypothetical protein [Candidatus Peregrinibacteria bacterium]
MSQIKEKIRRELSSLYLLNSQERDQLLSQMDNLPEHALTEILDIIENSKNDQKQYFSKINKIDPQFTKKLEIFLDGNADVLIADSIISKF